MKLILLNCSVVIAAKPNPAIPGLLQPAFLSSQGVVPSDWQLAENPICTPAISTVKYQRQIVFLAELNKLTVRDDNPSPESPVGSLATAFLEKLPPVENSAIGINFSGFVECENAEEWLVQRFVANGPWNNKALKPHAAAFKFVYAAESGVLNLGCQAGTLQKTEGDSEKPGLIISANYHTPVSPGSIDDTKSAINLFPKRLAHFTEIVDTIFGLE